jgi:hypothetical protein
MKYIFILLFSLPLAAFANKIDSLHTIEKITFSTSGGMTGGGSNLSIDSNRQASFSNKGYYNHPRGDYSGSIDTATYNKIVSMLNSMNFPALEDNYYIHVTDCTTNYLIITYDNGKVKKIQDYCRQGPKSLIALFDELFKIEETQKWKKVN